MNSCDEKTFSPPKISVVMPVYNTERYLRECVDSVLSQTFKDLELVLVDDGSPDKSGEICDELAKTDPRIRVFHKGNGGVTSARKLGVERARAEWICFIDSDDIMPENALKDLFYTAERFSYNVDLVEGSHVKFRKAPWIEAHEFFDEFRVPKICTTNGLGYAWGTLMPLSCRPFNDSPWAKIIRKNLFEKTRALDLPRWISTREDTLMDLLLATGIQTAVRIPQLVYEYRISGDSTSFSEENLKVKKSPSYIISVFKVLKDLYSKQDENWQQVATCFLRHTYVLRSSIRHCDLGVLNDPAYKEIWENFQGGQPMELPTKFFLARHSCPWKFLPDCIFKAIFTLIRNVYHPFELFWEYRRWNRFLSKGETLRSF